MLPKLATLAAAALIVGSAAYAQQPSAPLTQNGGFRCFGLDSPCPPNVEPVQTMSISSLAPAQGPVGTAVIITGVRFSATGNAIHFGSGGIPNVASGNGGTTLVFTVPYSVGPHDFNPQIMLPNRMVTPGTYEVYVINSQTEKSNSLMFTVTPKS